MKADLEAALGRLAQGVRGEASRVRPLLDLLARTPRPFARGQFDPGHITASACVLSRDGRETLLVHHARLERWLQPGGHVEPDDASVLAASHREVREECGIDDLALLAPGDPTPVDVDVHAIPERPGEPRHAHYDVRFAFVADRAQTVRASEESHAVRWVALSELGRYSRKPSVVRLVQRCAERFASRRRSGYNRPNPNEEIPPK